MQLIRCPGFNFFSFVLHSESWVKQIGFKVMERRNRPVNIHSMSAEMAGTLDHSYNNDNEEKGARRNRVLTKYPSYHTRTVS